MKRVSKWREWKPPLTARQKRFMRILNKQKCRCFYCGIKVKRSATLDHLVPKVKGGTNREENLVISCYYCNTKKSDSLSYYGHDVERIIESRKKTKKKRPPAKLTPASELFKKEKYLDL